MFSWETLVSTFTWFLLTCSTYCLKPPTPVHSRGLFQQDIAPCHNANTLQEWTGVSTWAPNSPDLDPPGLLWDVLDKPVWSRGPISQLKGLKGSSANILVPENTAQHWRTFLYTKAFILDIAEYTTIVHLLSSDISSLKWLHASWYKEIQWTSDPTSSNKIYYLQGKVKTI